MEQRTLYNQPRETTANLTLNPKPYRPKPNPKPSKKKELQWRLLLQGSWDLVSKAILRKKEPYNLVGKLLFAEDMGLANLSLVL